jgi:hypothetical protein
LSPFSVFQKINMADLGPKFSYFTGQLNKLKPSYLHLVESTIAGSTDVGILD